LIERDLLIVPEGALVVFHQFFATFRALASFALSARTRFRCLLCWHSTS
jgi:hypothetical protein